MKILVGIHEATEWDDARKNAVARTGKLDEFCAVALEQALRLKEQHEDVQVLAFCAASTPEAVLRQALALGADRAIGYRLTAHDDPWQVARLIAQLARQENPALILLGKQSTDWQSGVMTGLVAGLLNWAQAEPVSELQFAAGKWRALIYNEYHQVCSVLAPPVVLGVELGGAEPRYATLPSILRSRRLPLEWLSAEQINDSLLTYTALTPCQSRRRAQQLHSIDELVSLLKYEAENK
ncbi:hypothetical protein FEM41_11825 [Jejubacter calystegiae]|uniref:Electron transfer flavoprotein alpha/beta-subunit N-terminal domain-containing protein n=1 Tax=Jejubacter calystegiae TaxID=2579935 RepID=A0A4P8YK04_9ENTR|nr:hypothetical protein [Jejubacter calystegiae]QCT20286.1 hypothetical protein FEM41_11825 [Jejubacter calystegiae]